MKKKKKASKTIFEIIFKVLLLISVVIAFYKGPGFIAEKISYIQLKKKQINQDLSEE